MQNALAGVVVVLDPFEPNLQERDQRFIHPPRLDPRYDDYAAVICGDAVRSP
jgi:hypothetical protein